MSTSKFQTSSPARRTFLARIAVFAALTLAAAACSNPQPGPDKTAVGAVLGAGWGAGAGAVIGHQVSYAGEGAGIGAGFGAVAGAISGAGYDFSEGTQLDQERQLAALKVQNIANQREMERLQGRLDESVAADLTGGVYQVFFDDDATNLRAGAVANLEVIAESIKASPRAYTINVIGHTDDSGAPEYNERLAQSRARAVSGYLGSRGISMDQIKVSSHGAARPIATNGTPVGRQLNRRVDIYISR
jgi:outer membrane protein OmpA-like peptidoglycan-associated protein